MALGAAFFNKGENCIAAGRIFVEETIYDEFLKRAAVEVRLLAKTWAGPEKLCSQVAGFFAKLKASPDACACRSASAVRRFVVLIQVFFLTVRKKLKDEKTQASRK